MAAATSLIQLILKKWGDDAAGAAKELEEKVGFPESVANRIATGELPMDEASRVARREARYADEGLVHVNRGGIEGEGFDNSRLPSDDPDTPFNAHWFTTDPHPSTAFRKQGSDDPLTYTPVVLEKGRRGDWRDVVKYGESMGEDAGYGTQFREGLLNNGVSDLVVRGGDKIDQSTIDALPVDGRLKVDPDNKYGDRRNSLVKNDDGSLGFYEGSEHILDYDDLADYQRFNPEVSDVAVLDNTIIRSPNAAFDPEYTGSNIMGGAAGTAGLAGLLAAGQSEDADAGFITKGGKTLLEAFHGSPHKFDKFSMDQIGTGEGAQAYGHGLYFADSEDVARQYRDTLSLNGYQDNNANYSKALELGLSAGEFDRLEGMVRMAATKDGLDTGRISKDLQEYLQWPDDSMPALESFVGEYLDTLPKGALYRTEIDVTPESLLDWDAPISEQSEAVRELAKYHNLERSQSGLKENTGAGLYQVLGQRNAGADFDNSSLRGADKYANPILEEAGIKGIKYLDGRSRHPTQGEADIANEIRELEKKREIAGFMSGTPDVPDLSDSIKSLDGDIASRRQALKEMEDARQTSNYVIFDDSLINIAERGNATVPMLGATALGSAGLLAAPALMKGGVFQHTASETPIVERREPVRNQSSLLESVTDFNDEVIKSVKHAAGPLSLLMPYEGINDYLKVVNDYDKQPTWWDRVGLLDW